MDYRFKYNEFISIYYDDESGSNSLLFRFNNTTNLKYPIFMRNFYNGDKVFSIHMKPIRYYTL